MAGSFFFGVIPNAAAARENIDVDLPVDDDLLDDDENIEDLAAERNMADADEGLLAAAAAVVVDEVARSVDAPDEDNDADGRVDGCALAGRAVDAPE